MSYDAHLGANCNDRSVFFQHQINYNKRQNYSMNDSQVRRHKKNGIEPGNKSRNIFLISFSFLIV